MTTILDRPKSNRLPEPPAHPLWGHMRQAQADPLGFHLSLGAYGPVVGYRAGLWPVIFVHHPEAVGHVLQANYANYSKETFAYALVRRSLGDGLLTTDGERWLSRRRLMQPAFHRKRIEGLAPPMVAAAEAALARWQMGQPLEIAGEMRRLTLDVVGRTLFGVNTLDQAEPVGAALTTVLEQSLGQLRSRWMWLWGLLDTLTPGSRRFHTARRELDQVVEAIIARKRAQPQAENDLLDLLLAARDEESGAGLSDEELRTEVLTLLVAGHETTALALTWAVILLAQHPDLEQRLRAELNSTLAGRTPTMADLADLPYLDQVVSEVLRLYPPVWGFSRRAINADEIMGHPIPARSRVMISPYVTHRHPDFWPDPDRFDPDRFTPNQAALLPRFAYFPFGGGPRQCIGNTFALTEIKLVLATLLPRLHLTLADNRRIETLAQASLSPRYPIFMIPNQP
ncbi:MAG: cytochrome P450 [Caldilineaceae bacterium]|nr:cytochrome P450 [Caldilineaceae bacterium]MBP8108453.1 cytochrome P450 [Caldilineaceae bacterium]MBP8124613.1 cytochrome P450 [Caldilineaceae bacterium]MBP9074375.1 cytochrome P450 [Caldilineaceae bacterium]